MKFVILAPALCALAAAAPVNVEDTVNKAKGALDTATGHINGGLPPTQVGDVVSGAVDGVTGAVDGTLGRMARRANNGPVDNTVDGVTDSLGGATNALGNTVGGVTGNLGGLLDKLGKKVPGNNARDLDFESDLVEVDAPISVGGGLVDRDDTHADTGILDVHAPIELFPSSDKRETTVISNPVTHASGDVDLETRQDESEIELNVEPNMSN